ncbi:hypothetical protein BY996DRAFT_6505221 [Phakopsora pachyrhizi]|nr:hypothetical protein BY996DRAFT_6505221 [Phakopsora pachyrhizi]
MTGKDRKWNCQSQTKDKDKKHKTTVRESKIGIDTVTSFPIVNNDKDTSFKLFRDNEKSSSNRDKREMSNCGNSGIIKRDRSKEMIEKRNRKNLQSKQHIVKFIATKMIELGIGQLASCSAKEEIERHA